MTNHAENISHIFDALQVGLESADNPSEDFDRPEDINPDVFNRATVVIDGEVYTISVFRGTSEQNLKYAYETGIEFKRDYDFKAFEFPEGWRKDL